MPKERINNPAVYQYGAALPVLRDGMTEIAGVEGAALPLRTDPAVYVGWQGAAVGGHVQVALEMDAAHIEEVLEMDADTDPRVSMYTGLLDRADLNRMIRVLRRARDAAFGRDE